MNHAIPRQQAQRNGRVQQEYPVDYWLLVPILILVSLGVIMVGSASIAVAESMGMSSAHYLIRHLMYIFLGLILATGARLIPVSLMEKTSQLMFPLALLALLLVFIPGIGHTVNGSTRWLKLGFMTFQVVEAVKIMFIIYVASYQFFARVGMPQTSPSGALIDPGLDLNMEGGMAEHVKDLVILTTGVHVRVTTRRT